jgi:NAD(P)H dehydrogenase (quinone)
MFNLIKITMENILITGATGQLGNDVTNLLINRIDPKNVSILVRDPAKAEKFKSRGVKVLQGDYEDYTSLLQAFKGVDKLYFISANDLSKREAQHINVVKAAAESEVKHIIYTGFQRKNETESSPISFIAKAHLTAEKLIKQSSMAYTILNHGLYMEFILGILGDQFPKSETIYFPSDDGKVAFTLRSDLAAGAVEILTTKGHENKTYNFFSDKKYSFRDVANVLTKIINKPIAFVSPKAEDYKATMQKAGVPEMYIGLFAGFAEAIKQGEFDSTDQTLSKIIGRECVGIEEFLSGVYKK